MAINDDLSKMKRGFFQPTYKFSWVIIKVFGVVCIILGGLGYACHRLENTRSYFETYEDMKAAGMIDAGWIPDYIPRTATEIHETHDIDTNIVKMKFKYEASDTKSVERHCEKTEQIRDYIEFRCPNKSRSRTFRLYDDGTGTYTNRADRIP